MSIPSQQIGWDSKTKLMWQIAKQFEYLTKVFSQVVISPSGNNVLTLKFDDIANADLMIAGSSSDVTVWNTFFDLPTNGIPFTSVSINVNTVTLIGGANISLRSYIFGDNVPTNNCLLEVVDTGCVIECTEGVFSDYNIGVGCFALTKIHLPACSILGNSVFADCYALIDLILGNVTSLGESVFQYCSSIPSINLPNITSAGGYCFSDCIAISSFNFPLLTTVGEGVFANCSLASTFNLPSLSSLSVLCFGNCDALISTNDIVLSSITQLPYSAFAGCDNLTTVDFPLVTTVDNECFIGCVALTSVNLPSVTDLGSTVGDDNVFFSISGQTIDLTIPTALMTCNAGNPDGDIQYLQANNTVNITTV